MAEWITIPAFANNQVIQAEDFQDILTDLNTLKNPQHAYQKLPGPSVQWTLTSTGSWLDIDATYYRLQFESFGNDVLIGLYIRCTHLTASSGAWFDLVLDGTRVGAAQGGSNQGFTRFQITSTDSARETYFIPYIWESCAAGTHLVVVQYYNGAGTLEVFKDAVIEIFAQEF